MRGWSFSVGRFFGVQVRMHLFFLFLLGLSMAWAGSLGRAATRGFILWILLVLAVVLREAARGLTAASFSIETRSILLLPIGGIVTYASSEATARATQGRAQQAIALAGPFASLAFGLSLAGMIVAVAPQVDVISLRWIAPDHLLRAFVWINLLLGAVNLLPVWPLDGGRGIRPKTSNARFPGTVGFGPGFAFALIAAGVVLTNFWMIAAGITILLMVQMEREGGARQAGADLLKVRDVMLTEYSLLSASATLEDAVEQSKHTLQDVFPVVRGGNMVGAVSRTEVLQALGTRGNGYVQGIMTRIFQTAAPEDSLVETLGRVTSQTGVSAQIVPVTVGDRIVGILTAHHLQRSMGLMAMAVEAGQQRAAEDESR